MRSGKIAAGAFLLWSIAVVPDGRAESIHFPICDTGKRITCVIDGDTIWLNGVKIRLEGIDAPEIGGARCIDELGLGVRAQKRLAELLNGGEFELIRVGTRDQDRYGRKLRTVMIGGKDVGEILIGEGLAKPWTGTKAAWCQ